jgi:hypothetical protein
VGGGDAQQHDADHTAVQRRDARQHGHAEHVEPGVHGRERAGGGEHGDAEEVQHG